MSVTKENQNPDIEDPPDAKERKLSAIPQQRSSILEVFPIISWEAKPEI
jgi:hypothetical protein